MKYKDSVNKKKDGYKETEEARVKDGESGEIMGAEPFEGSFNESLPDGDEEGEEEYKDKEDEDTDGEDEDTDGDTDGGDEGEEQPSELDEINKELDELAEEEQEPEQDEEKKDEPEQEPEFNEKLYNNGLIFLLNQENYGEAYENTEEALNELITEKTKIRGQAIDEALKKDENQNIRDQKEKLNGEIEKLNNLFSKNKPSTKERNELNDLLNKFSVVPGFVKDKEATQKQKRYNLKALDNLNKVLDHILKAQNIGFKPSEFEDKEELNKLYDNIKNTKGGKYIKASGVAQLAPNKKLKVMAERLHQLENYLAFKMGDSEQVERNEILKNHFEDYNIPFTKKTGTPKTTTTTTKPQIKTLSDLPTAGGAGAPAGGEEKKTKN